MDIQKDKRKKQEQEIFELLNQYNLPRSAKEKISGIIVDEKLEIVQILKGDDTKMEQQETKKTTNEITYTREEVLCILDEWGVEGFMNGYTFSEDPLLKVPRVEKIDVVGKFKSDAAAGIHLTSQGMELINFMESYYRNTPETREAIIRYLKTTTENSEGVAKGDE